MYFCDVKRYTYGERHCNHIDNSDRRIFLYSQILSFCISCNSNFICTIWAITQKLSQTANYLLEEGGAQKQDEEKIAFSKTQPISAVSFVTL